MKKLITFLFLLAVVLVNAQNKQETLKWLKKQKTHMLEGSSNRVEEGKFEMTEDYIKLFSNKNGEKEETIIKWSQIRNINQMLHDSGRYSISITLKQGEYDNILFFSKVDPTALVDKLAHMAKLNDAEVEIGRNDVRGWKF